MSLTIAFCNSHGIVMAADRFITTTVDGASFCGTTTEQKLFLSPEGFGFTYAGTSTFRNHPASYWMDRFIERFSHLNLNVHDYVQNLCTAFHFLDKSQNIIIIGAGCTNGTNHVYSSNSISRIIVNHLYESETCISVSGENDLALRIIDTYPINRNVFTTVDMVDFVRHVILTASNIQKFAQRPITISPECDVLLITSKMSKWVIPSPNLWLQ